MKNAKINTEILLVANSAFFKRDWCEIRASKNDRALSQKKQLIKLCWNGMLNEMIPEICDNKLTLWEINDSGNLLDLRYGDIDVEMNDEWSINPYVFLTFANPN